MDIFNKEKLEEKEKEIESLKEKIERLKKEKLELKNRAEKEKERAKKAVTKKQEADRELNLTQDKIKSLEDRLERFENKEKQESVDELNFNKFDFDSGMNLLERLSSFESSSEDLLTLISPSGHSLKNFENFETLKDKMDYKKYKALSKRKDKSYIYLSSPYVFDLYIELPFVKEPSWKMSKNFEISDSKKELREKVGMLFLNAGGSGLCVYENGEILKQEVIRSDVKSKHKKGGYSQKRFERLRERQIEEHVDEVESMIDGFFTDDLKKFIVSGNSDMLKKFDSKRLQTDVFYHNVSVSKVKNDKNMRKSVKEITSFRIAIISS